MMQIAPLAAADPVVSASGADTSQAASAFGLGFDALLKIILTQLTYQDPLKPMDNFEFVSQLAQFSQIQQGQTANDRLQTLVDAQGASQATSLLGAIVDIPTNTELLSGKVIGVTFASGAASITIETAGGDTISGLSLSSISQVRQGE